MLASWIDQHYTETYAFKEEGRTFFSIYLILDIASLKSYLEFFGTVTFLKILKRDVFRLGKAFYMPAGSSF